jgi:putative redox protein
MCEAADDHLVRGVATMGSPSTLRDWAQDAGRLLAHARSMGMIRSAEFPPDAARWVRDIGRIDAVKAAARLDRRPLLVLHGADDTEVPVADARALADAARPSSELRLVQGAGHRVRHDPRAIATLLGWLARQVPSGTATEVPTGN